MFKTYFIYQDQQGENYAVETSSTRGKGNKVVDLLNPQSLQKVKSVKIIDLVDYELNGTIVVDKDGKIVNY